MKNPIKFYVKCLWTFYLKYWNVSSILIARKSEPWWFASTVVMWAGKDSPEIFKIIFKQRMKPKFETMNSDEMAEASGQTHWFNHIAVGFRSLPT